MQRRVRALRSLSTPQLEIQEVQLEERRYLVARGTVEHERFMGAVEDSIAAQHRVEKWREWQGAPTVNIALPLSGDPQRGCYYAFLPMETEAPFHGFIDAPFFPDPDRKDLALSNPLNDVLLDVAAEICLATYRRVAETNEARPDFVHAAVDALAWHSERDRIFKAINAVGLKLGDLPLPIVKRPDREERWGTLDSVFDWRDEDFEVLKGSWIGKVTDEELLRRNLGARRTEVLRDLAKEAGMPLEPWPSRLAGWVPDLAADIARRRKASLQPWEQFYSDLAKLERVLPLLKGMPFFRNEAGKLVTANGGPVGTSEFFIHANADGTNRRRKLADVALFPPASITKGLEFADPAVAWPRDAVAAFVKHGLASEFNLPHVLGRIGRLLGSKPRKRDASAALSWAFGAWKSQKSVEVETALRSSGLPVPVSDGSMIDARKAHFSSGWHGTQGEQLSEYCVLATSHSRTVAALAKKLLLPWANWPAGSKGTQADWLTFLRLVGVQDGLKPVQQKDVGFWPWGWRSFFGDDDGTESFEANMGPYWRKALASTYRTFGYESGQYTAHCSYLPGQGKFEAMPADAKLAFARLFAQFLSDAPAAVLETLVERQGARADTRRWPSPIAAFAEYASWVPVELAEGFEGRRLADCWFSPRADPLPRFVPRIARVVRDLLDTTPHLRDRLTKLGLPLWHDPASADKRLAFLGKTLAEGIAEAERDTFRKAYRETWEHRCDHAADKPLPETLSLVVERRGELSTVELARGGTTPTVYVGDGSSLGLEQLIGALGHPVVVVPAGRAETCVALLQKAFGNIFERLRAEAFTVCVDGEPFEPGTAAVPLAGPGREWLVEVAVLLLEASASLSSQATARTRETLSERIRKVQIRFASEISVSSGDSEASLPPELDGVLPIADARAPTIIVTAAPEFNWTLMSRVAAALAQSIGRPGLVAGFRLGFLAIERAMAAGGGAFALPDEPGLAKALALPVTRIREVLRSVRSTNERLLRFLAPAVHALHGKAAAQALLDNPSRLIDDSDIIRLLGQHAVAADDAASLIARCRDADTLNTMRMELGISFPAFNAVLTGLGAPYAPLNFAPQLQMSFASRIEERRPLIEQFVRDRYKDLVAASTPLADYIAERTLEWLVMPGEWPDLHDDVTDALIDAEIDAQLARRAGRQPVFADEPTLDGMRQGNRAVLVAGHERLRRLVRAWAAKAENRTVPACWANRAEQLAREAVGSGTFDFDNITDENLPAALHRARMWPDNMPRTVSLPDLGLKDADLASEQEAEKQDRDADLKRKRSVRFGTVDIDGGSETPLDDLARILESALISNAFRRRSGPTQLKPFVPGPRTQPRPGGSRGGGTDPVYLSDEQRTLLGFAGELAAYHYLKCSARGFADEHWISAMGRRFLGLPAMQDDDGFDFRIPRSRGAIHYEVKAHGGDPGYLDLERSQVAAAAAMAAEGANRWRILYVTNVRNPALITVHELLNPYSAEGAKYYREHRAQGVRLLIQRKD